MIYTYTTDLPSTDPRVNARLGIKLPFRILWPPYMSINPYFVDYTNAIDEVFDSMVTEKIEILGNIRNMWVGNPMMEQKVNLGQIVKWSDWSIPERNILIKQVNMLGMKLSKAGVVTDSGYLAIARFIGQYWLEKGKYTCIDFLNFCIGTQLEIQKLWTENYLEFLPEGDPLIGTPIWEGGTWYPTTHVSIVAHGGLQISPAELTGFFYDISNYNLVLQAINEYYTMYIGTGNGDGTIADIVAVALLCENSVVVSTIGRYGADPPLSNNADWTTTKIWSTQAAPVFYLAKPTSWMFIQGKKIPVYGENSMTIKESTVIGTSSIGTGNLKLSSAFTWAKIPGSSKSKARIPVYTTPLIGSQVRQLPYAVTNYIGEEAIPITDPDGFLEIASGQYAPYWNDTP